MRVYVVVTIALLFAPRFCAAQTTDSVMDFSGVQGVNQWFYGIYDQGPQSGAPHGYTPQAFVEFDQFDAINSAWSASDSLVGAQNNDFLNLGDSGGHPTGTEPSPQDSIIWPIRRYVVPTEGFAQIEIDLRKENIDNPRGGGITGRVFVDGREVMTQLIENANSVGVQRTLNEAVQVGSTIDFAIDPTGLTPLSGSDGLFSARADASIFSANIQIVPEPAGSFLFAVGLVVCLGPARRAARTTNRS